MKTIRASAHAVQATMMVTSAAKSSGEGGVGTDVVMT